MCVFLYNHRRQKEPVMGMHACEHNTLVCGKQIIEFRSLRPARLIQRDTCFYKLNGGGGGAGEEKKHRSMNIMA